MTGRDGPSRTAAPFAGRGGSDILLLMLGLGAFGLLGWYLSLSHGRLDAWDHAVGRDFVNLWTAGRLVLAGRAVEVFDPARFWPDEHVLFSPRLPFHFWSYPPPALFLAAPLGLLAYFPALALWTAAGLVALAPATRAFLGGQAGARGRRDLPLLLLSPAVATNIGLGQNGALTAALLLGGLALLDRRPRVAGALLGLLVFKPQIALLLPVMVLAGRRWRVMTWAVGSGTALLALSAAVFGPDAWRAFFAHTLPMQTAMLSHGRGPFMWMMPSAYTGARILGADAPAALWAQAPFTLFAAVLVWAAFRSDAEAGAKAAVVALATFVASPQAFNYDLIPAAAAALALWRLEGGWRGWRGLGRLLALSVWALPVAMMPLQAWRVPVAPVVLAAALARLAVAGGVLARRRAAPGANLREEAVA